MHKFRIAGKEFAEPSRKGLGFDQRIGMEYSTADDVGKEQVETGRLGKLVFAP